MGKGFRPVCIAVRSTKSEKVRSVPVGVIFIYISLINTEKGKKG